MIKICEHCKREFETPDKRQKYCGRDCYFKSKSKTNNKVKTNCKNCGEEVARYPSEILKSVYCSRQCLYEYRKRYHSVKVKCYICHKEFVKSKHHYDNSVRDYCSYECANKGHSKFLVGKNNPGFLNTYTNCSYCGKRIYRKKSVLEKHKDFFCSTECQGNWLSENNRGKDNPRYNPNLTDEERENERSIEGYAQWRIAVYERDNYTCQICNDDKGGNLNAHHLNSYKWDKANRTNVDNGITLCEECHKEYHSIFGSGENTKEEFKNYIKSIKKAL